ncbi:hypothetical protein BJL93_07955 [Bifidobacterium bifidum]|nr:hypothetical protein BJL93_07955 [Bifidobacterium bifidum]
MKWTNSYRSFGLKTKRSTGLKTIEHKHVASPSGIRGTRNRRRSGGSRGGDSKRPHRPSGHRTPERTEPSIM